MNKIIKGKRYDTETAQKMAEWSSSYAYSDFNYYDETLYRKRTGEYFLYGRGNAASKYAESCGQNSWMSGEEIIPLSIEQARKWAEEHCDGDEYEEIFGKIEEGGEKIQVKVYLDRATSEKLKIISQEAGVSASDMVAKLINNA